MCDTRVPLQPPDRPHPPAPRLDPFESAKSRNAPDPLHVFQFGRVRIKRGDETLPPCPMRKATAVLRILLIRPGFEAHRDELAELLWPEGGERQALHSLHVAISTLRKHLDQPGITYLEYQSSFYRLTAGTPVYSDVAHFEESVRRAQSLARAGSLERGVECFQRALDLYTDDFSVEDRSEQWAIDERERLLMIYLRSLEHIGDLYLETGEDAAALETFMALLERDTYREDVHARVMWCYWRMGRRREAIHQFDKCAQVLRADLGIDPMPSLVLLVSDIKANAEMRDIASFVSPLNRA